MECLWVGLITSPDDSSREVNRQGSLSMTELFIGIFL